MKLKKKLLVIKPSYQAFPVGLAYVLSCLEANDIPFDFIDSSLYFQDYKRNLRKNDYLAVASGGLNGHFYFFGEIIREVRMINPDLPVILGGNITKDIRPDFLFDKIGMDYGIIGEAETSLPYLINAINEESDDLRGIPGLLFRDKFSGKIVKNLPRRLNLQNVNVLPAWQYFDMDYYSRDYYLPFCGGNHSAMPILSGRGCVGHCTFCSPTIGYFQMRPIEHVLEEIQILKSSYDFEWLIFFNEMFYQSKEKILAFCREYKNRKIDKPWICALRADVDIDVDTFITMKEAGCICTSAGIESGSDKVLKLMKKIATKEKIRSFFRDVRKAKLACNGTFMVGNEGENEDDLRHTIDMVINDEMNSDASLTNAYSGTEIYKNAVNRGLIKDEWEYLRNSVFSPGVFEDRKREGIYINVSDIPNDRFWEVIAREMRRYYTFLFNRYQAKQVSFKFLFGALCIEANGICPTCGERITAYPPFVFLEMEVYCPRCFYRVNLDIYKAKGFAKHFESLSRELRKAERLVILGTEVEASALLRIDRFGIDYNKIKGFLDINPGAKRRWRSIYINIPRLQAKDLLQIQPDLILVADDELGDAEVILKLFCLKEGRDFFHVMHLFPDSRRWSLMLTRLIEKFNLRSKKDRRLYQRALILILCVLRYTASFEKIIFSLEFLIRRLPKMTPKIIYKKIIHKVKYLSFKFPVFS